MVELNKIYNEDCIKTLRHIKEDGKILIDLTVTSPPYNVNLGNNKNNDYGYDSYNDNKDYDEYIKWLESIFSMIFECTFDGGRCAINIGDGKNGSVTTHADIIYFMKKIGWIPMTTIIWNKKNVSSRTAWGSFMSPSSPSFPCPFEYIMIFSKGTTKLEKRNESMKADVLHDEFIESAYGIWEFSGARKELHPAAFPIDLPVKCMKMLSYTNSIIYDPFMGSGTTAIAALRNDRNFIGSEISENYFTIANERIENELKQTKLW